MSSERVRKGRRKRRAEGHLALEHSAQDCARGSVPCPGQQGNWPVRSGRGDVCGVLPAWALLQDPPAGLCLLPSSPALPARGRGLLERQTTLRAAPGRLALKAEWRPWLRAPCLKVAQRPEAAPVSLAHGAAPVVTCPAACGRATGAPGGPAGLTVNLR